ncbi:MAG TPA: hypothetical protein VGI95_00795 [Caulobacteraceae bacterium]|jgi:hypothetical protein
MQQASATAAPDAGAIVRLVSADAHQALEQIQASSLLSEGRVCLMGLDPVRERMGPRWVGRRQMVYDYIQQTLRRQLGAHGFFLRISETDFLVAQPAVSRLAGQAYCLNCLREVLTYFLGEALITDIVVHEVRSIDGGSVGAQRLDATAIEAEAEALSQVPAAASAAQTARPQLTMTSQDRWTPFVANDGRTLRASCQLEPVFQLKTYGRIGYRMRRRVLRQPGDTPLTIAEQRKLTGGDIEKIDFATLARGLNRIEQEGDGERQPSLILPVSFTTLTSGRGRTILAEFFRAAQSSVQRGLICEVCDIEGVPPSALLAATSLMRPFCLFIVGRLAQIPSNGLSSLKDAGLQGISIERPASVDSDEAFDAFAKTVVCAAKPVVRAVMLYGVDGPRQAALASLHGATHASFAPAKSQIHYIEDRIAAPA